MFVNVLQDKREREREGKEKRLNNREISASGEIKKRAKLVSLYNQIKTHTIIKFSSLISKFTTTISSFQN